MYIITHTRDMHTHTGWYPASSMTPKCGSTTKTIFLPTSALWKPTCGCQRRLLVGDEGPAYTQAHTSTQKNEIHRDLPPSRIRENRVWRRASRLFVMNKKSGNCAGVWYVPKLSVPGNQFRVVPVLLRAFSGHKTMMYTWEVGSTILTKLRRHRGLDFHFIFYCRVDIYTPSSTVKCGNLHPHNGFPTAEDGYATKTGQLEVHISRNGGNKT